MASHKPWGCRLPVHVYTNISHTYICTQACINLCVKFIKLYTYTYMHIYIHIPTLTIELTFLTLVNQLQAQYNYIILVPIPSTFSDAGQVCLCIQLCVFMYVCIYIRNYFSQSCIISINSPFTIGFGTLNSVKSTSGKLYMFIVTKNILYIYIYIYMTETYCVHMFSESGYILAIR